MSEKQFFEVSWKTLLKVSAVAIGFYLIFLIKNILIWFLFALIISVLFNPTINFLEKRRIPRMMAVVLVYLAFIGILGTFFYTAAILFLHEAQQFVQFLPQYWEKISPALKIAGLPAFDSESFFQTLGANWPKISQNLVGLLFSFFGGIFSGLFIISMAIFLSLERKPVERTLSLFFPKSYEVYLISIWERCQKRVSGWFLTRIIGCLFVGLVSYLVFLVFDVQYPFSLSLIAGVLNFIPVVGPMLTGALIFLITFFDSGTKAIFILIGFILVQQVENHILLPVLSKKFIGLSPVLVLMSLAIGGILWGFLGAILAVPLAGIVFEFLKEFLEKRKEHQEVLV